MLLLISTEHVYVIGLFFDRMKR